MHCLQSMHSGGKQGIEDTLASIDEWRSDFLARALQAALFGRRIHVHTVLRQSKFLSQFAKGFWVAPHETRQPVMQEMGSILRGLIRRSRFKHNPALTSRMQRIMPSIERIQKCYGCPLNMFSHASDAARRARIVRLRVSPYCSRDCMKRSVDLTSTAALEIALKG
jgi:hypothetical protein